METELTNICTISEVALKWASLAAAIATVLAVVVAWYGVTKTINNSRDLAKTKQALDLVTGDKSHQLHEAGIRVIKESYPDSHKVLMRLAGEKGNLSERGNRDADALYELLNWYEYLANAIRFDLISEEYIRKTSFTSTMYVWEAAQPFIQGVRERVRSDTFCEALEWLVHRWELAGYYGTLPKL
jgi:hypothetical protein